MRSVPIYLPICLYHYSLYRKKTNVHYVFRRHIVSSEKALILICDDLHAYNLIMKKALSTETAFGKARAEGDKMFRMISRIMHRFAKLPEVRIMRWRDLAGTRQYSAVFRRLLKVFKRERGLRNEVSNLVRVQETRLRGNDSKLVRRWETRYLLEEIAMSIHVAETLGYSTEIWESPPNGSSPDPLSFLYLTRSDLVREISGAVNLSRVQKHLCEPSRGRPCNVFKWAYA